MATLQTPEEELSSFISSLDHTSLPDEIDEFVEERFVDTVGVMIAGSTRDPGQTLKHLAPQSVNSELALSDFGFSLGVIGHTLDFDDSTHATHSHISVTVIPTILAMSKTEKISGSRAVVAYAAGYETAYYLANFVMDGHYKKGWHGTATLGTYAATAAAASILDLSQHEIHNAINIASSMPAGSRANFGTWMKPVHAGHAIRSGMTAALLADNGCDASETVISGRYGFMDLYDAPENWEKRERHDLGEDWGMIEEGVNTKKYPSCHATHAAIETTIELMQKDGVEVIDIEEIEIVTSEFPSHNLHYEDPQSGLQGKFSMPYTVACAAVNHVVELQMFDDEAVDDPEVQAVRERVKHTIDNSYPYNNKTTVKLKLTDGRTLEKTLEAPPGVRTEEELYTKFQQCTRPMDDADREALLALLDSVAECDDVTELLAYILD